MGWLYMKSLKGHSGPRQYLDAQFTWERSDTISKVLRSALVGMRVYYAAVEHILPATGAREVWVSIGTQKGPPIGAQKGPRHGGLYRWSTGGTHAAPSARQEADAAARGGACGPTGASRVGEAPSGGQSRPNPRGGSIAWSSAMSRSQIVCNASAVGLSCRLDGMACSQTAY